MALMSTVEAKEQSVDSEGIGEDLNINIFCWQLDNLAIMLQAKTNVQQANIDHRFDLITKVACISRRGWGVTAFTMASEGYISITPEETRDTELKQGFIDGKGVKECLTVTHIDNGRVTIVVRPYTYTVPRKMVWGDDIYYPGRTIVRQQDGKFPNMFDRVLTTIEVDELPDDADTYYDELSKGIEDIGFWIQRF